MKRHIIGEPMRWFGFLVTTIVLCLLAGNANSFEFKKAHICKAGLASLFYQKTQIITVDREEGEVLFLSYIRPSDGSKWSYKCKVEGNRIIWGASDGRWRVDPADSLITYTTQNNSIKIVRKHSDGSTSVKQYTASELYTVAHTIDPNDPLSIYYNAIKEHIDKHWNYKTTKSADLEVVLNLKINRDGYIVGKRVEKLSPDKEYNMIVMKGLAGMNPFPAMPEVLKGEQFEMKVTIVPE